MRPWLALLLLGCGASSPAGGTREPGAQASVPEWMAGVWRAQTDEGATEEQWWVEDGHLLGFNRSVASYRTIHHELLRIDAAGYLAAPEGQAITRFAMGEGGAQTQTFENPTHEFPRWIRYARQGDVLHASIGGEGTEPAAQWRFERVGEPPSRVTVSARICRAGDRIELTVAPCHCGAEVYCAALAGELVVAILDHTCDACEEARGGCEAPPDVGPASGCEDTTIPVLGLAVE